MHTTAACAQSGHLRAAFPNHDGAPFSCPVYQAFSAIYLKQQRKQGHGDISVNNLIDTENTYMHCYNGVASIEFEEMKEGPVILIPCADGSVLAQRVHLRKTSHDL